MRLLDGDKAASEREWQPHPGRRQGWRRASVSKCMPAHGLDYASAEAISSLPEIAELNIGHS